MCPAEGAHREGAVRWLPDRGVGLGINKNTVQGIFQMRGWKVSKRGIGARPRSQALPSRDDLKSSLKGRELNMISERELRNLRRDATIIYR